MFVCLDCIFNMHWCVLVWVCMCGRFVECLCACACACAYVFNTLSMCMCAHPSLGVYINEHLSVSLMPYSIRPPILCVQLIARTSAGVCVFLTLANRSMALHTNVPLHQPHPCQPHTYTHTLRHTLKWHFLHFNFQVDTLIQSKLSKGQRVEKPAFINCCKLVKYLGSRAVQWTERTEQIQRNT